MCTMSRYLLVAAFAGVAGSSLSGSDPIGVLVAGVAVLLLLAAGRLFPGRLGPSTCALPTQDAPARQTDEPRSESARHN